MRQCRGKSHFTERIKLRNPAANPTPMPASKNHGEVSSQRSRKYPSNVPTSNPASRSEDARKARPQAAPDEGGGSSGPRSSPRKRSRRWENSSRSDGSFPPVPFSSLEATINMPENRCATNARTLEIAADHIDAATQRQAVQFCFSALFFNIKTSCGESPRSALSEITTYRRAGSRFVQKFSCKTGFIPRPRAVLLWKDPQIQVGKHRVQSW